MAASKSGSEKIPNPWRPDWRIPEKYPSPDECVTPLEQWVWEFLRRNQEYQVFYRDRIEPLITDWHGFGRVPVWPPVHLIDTNGLSESEASALATDQFPNPYSDILETWGIRFPSDPAENVFHMNLGSEFDFIGRFCGMGGACPPNLPPPKIHEMRFSIDLRRPIGAQIEKIKKEAEWEQEVGVKQRRFPKIDKRNRTVKFPEYLRILDARYEGASISEIATVLYPNIINDKPDYADQMVRNGLKRAQELVDGDYRMILA